MPLPKDDETPFRAEVVRLACAYGRYGYRTIAGMMRIAGWTGATPSKLARIWRAEGLKIPQKQPPRGRLWLNDGSCICLSATHPNYVWSYDFVFIRDAYGGKIRILTLIDEFSRRCLTVHCARRIGSIRVIEQLANTMVSRNISVVTMALSLLLKSYEAGYLLSEFRQLTLLQAPLGRMAFAKA